MGTYCFFSKTREQSNPTKSFNRQVQLFTLIGDSVKFLTMTPNDPCCVFTHTLKDPALAFILMLIQSTVWLEGRIKWQGKMEVLSCQRQISVHRAGNVCVCVSVWVKAVMGRLIYPLQCFYFHFFHCSSSRLLLHPLPSSPLHPCLPSWLLIRLAFSMQHWCYHHLLGSWGKIKWPPAMWETEHGVLLHPTSSLRC